MKNNNIITQIKRTVLVVEDEIINQEILKTILSADYDILTAENGIDALHVLETSTQPISGILLDINMPIMNGFEFLKVVKEKEEFKKIPVIVLTSAVDSELESLQNGAVDFIKKPYNVPEVILARVNRIIELSEDRMIIQASERDQLTHVYNKHIFTEYVSRIDEYNPSIKTDLFVLNIERFHLINELYGKEYGDDVLKTLADELRAIALKNDGIVGRLQGDYFVVYLNRIEDYSEIISEINKKFEEKYGVNNVHLRLGIYQVNDKSLLPETRIDRAKIVCDQIRRSNRNQFLVYNTKDQENSLFKEQLIHDFSRAIKNKEFIIYFQPKFDVKGDVAKITSAEALVRWIHPEHGFISPGVFIPLFEECGFIRTLDKYVWYETAKHISEWKKKYKHVVPVSVNVSRIDLFDDNIVEIFADYIKEFNIETRDMYLEITESAYNDDVDQLIRIINELRNEGFKIEIDDFGSGYSSLNNLASINFDVLKLDMKFVREMYNNEKTLKMIEIVADIAKFLNVTLVAEGVETKEQLEQLKEFGYYVIQGYYFSKPLSDKDFEKYLEE